MLHSIIRFLRQTWTVPCRPDYHSEELKDAQTWLEMEGIDKSKYTSTEKYVEAAAS